MKPSSVASRRYRSLLPTLLLTASPLCVSPCLAVVPQSQEVTQTPGGPASSQKADAKDDGIAVNASGQAHVDIHQTIQRRDPEVRRLLQILQARVQELNDELATLRRGEEERRRLLEEQADGVAEIVHKANEPNASPAALAAKRGLEQGNTLNAEAVLSNGERIAADKQALGRAAELAREQGALAVSHDTAAALAAYQRAAQYEPDNPDNWQMVGDLLMQSLKRPEAVQAYRRVVDLAEASAQKNPTDVVLTRRLLKAYRRLAYALLAQDEIDHAAASVRDSIDHAEHWYTMQRRSPEAKEELIYSLMLVGELRSDEIGSGLETGKFGLGLPLHDSFTAMQAETDRLAEVSEAAYQRAVTLIDEVLRQDPDKDKLALDRIRCEFGIILARSMMSGHADLTVAQATSIALFEAVAAKEPNNYEYQFELVGEYRSLGLMYSEIKNAQAALDAYQKSLSILRELSARNPSSPQIQLNLAISYAAMAKLASVFFYVPSLFDPNYRNYLRTPIIQPAEVLPLVRAGIDIITRLKKQGLLTPAQQRMDIELYGDLYDLECQQKGFESGQAGDCFRPLPPHLR